MTNNLVESIRDIPRVEVGAADEYAQKIDVIVEEVNRIMESRDDLAELTGGNPLEVMKINHRNHAATLANVLRLGRYDMLALTMPWVYRAYMAHGFSGKYFPVVFDAFEATLSVVLSPESEKSIKPLYIWMKENHAAALEARLKAVGISTVDAQNLAPVVSSFQLALLEGDYSKCLELMAESVRGPDDIESFYLQVIQPSMYGIGEGWERGEISVAEEHLASAVVTRVMAALYPQVAGSEKRKGKIVVTAAPNEYHEIGSRMLADLLEQDGWDVDYLGSNVDVDSAFRFIKSRSPFILAVSSALAFTIDGALRITEKLRNDPETSGIKIMVGGLAYANVPDVWNELPVDGYAPDAAAGVALASRWWKAFDQRVTG